MEVFEKLTAREQEILNSLAEGLSNRAIAERYSLALASVKWYNNQIFSKLGSRSRAQAVERARELGLLTAQPERPATNLPLELTSLVGRETELAEIALLLANPAARLLTTIGAGGCGKTRLALRAGAERAEKTAREVWLVEFAPYKYPDTVVQAVVSALGIVLDPGLPPLEGLVRHLSGRNILLIFDNCEHLIDALAHLAEALLRACPLLEILATSREPLGIPGEVTFRVPSLSIPPEGWDGAPEAFSAVQLFIERAAGVRPDFQLAEGAAAVVGRICRRLDGIPLAIELAAARVNLLSVDEIEARLDDVFHLLTAGSRTALPRQQTLRGSIEWSCRLLEPAEKLLMARLSIFTGGWNYEAAEAVGADDDDGLPRAEVFERLASLVNKSLVTADTNRSEPRYSMLEVVRQYGLELLAQSGKADAVRERHYQWCLAYARTADAQVMSAERRVWISRLENELPNMCQALQFSLSAGQPSEKVHQLASTLAQFWQLRGYLREGMGWIEAALARSDGVSLPVLTRTYIQASFISLHLWRLDRAQQLLETALDRSRAYGSSGDTATALCFLGLVFLLKRDFTRARSLTRECLEISRTGEPDFITSVALLHLGDMAFLEGDVPQANTYYAESLAVSRQVGNEMAAARRLVRLSQSAALLGDLQRAQDLLTESLQANRGAADRWLTAMQVVTAASLSCERGVYQQAARLLGTAQVLMETFGTHHLWAVDHQILEDRRRLLFEKLGSKAFNAAVRDGHRLAADLERGLDLAQISEGLSKKNVWTAPA